MSLRSIQNSRNVSIQSDSKSNQVTLNPTVGPHMSHDNPLYLIRRIFQILAHLVAIQNPIRLIRHTNSSFSDSTSGLESTLFIH